MNEDYVSFELAKKLKEKGYPQKTFGRFEMTGACYISDGKFYEDGCIAPVDICFAAPTMSQVLKWLREEKGLHIVVELDHNHKYEWYIQHTSKMYGKMSSHFNNRHERFEHSALAAIEYAIDNLT